ncbi:NAD(P)-dependent dehydrogenase (short-subunit alcohol dehydrogenase family) [Paenibacillus sp. DS2363]|uniref:SDR family NAD(P)-dependent oxidoreductase n=1 Tax=unclassified Paenibacillus TaxID=185978 RepID=UPI0030F69B3F
MRSPEKETELITLHNVFVLRLDVEKEDTIQPALTEAIGWFGKIDVLLNNAGCGTMDHIEVFTESRFEDSFK